MITIADFQLEVEIAHLLHLPQVCKENDQSMGRCISTGYVQVAKLKGDVWIFTGNWQWQVFIWLTTPPMKAGLRGNSPDDAWYPD